MQWKLTKANVLKSLREFDLKLGDKAAWSGWEENHAHKYAILHDRRRYPVKKIASMAGGVPVSAFSGGDHTGHANKLLEGSG